MDVGAWTAAEVASGAAVAQALVLLGALLYAARQLREAKRTREATDRPFVVIDATAEQPPVFELTVTNIGPVMATDVHFDIDPPLTSSLDEYDTSLGQLQMFTTGIKQLPPGKVFRVLYDSALQRWADDDSQAKPGYPDVHNVTVHYVSALDGRSFHEPAVIDVGVYRNVSMTTRRDVHDLVKQVEALAKAAAAWTSTLPRGLRTVTVADEQRAAQEARRRIERRRQAPPEGAPPA